MLSFTLLLELSLVFLYPLLASPVALSALQKQIPISCAGEVFNTLNNSLKVRDDREGKLAQEKYVCSKNIIKVSPNTGGKSKQSFFSSGKMHQYSLEKGILCRIKYNTISYD